MKVGDLVKELFGMRYPRSKGVGTVISIEERMSEIFPGSSKYLEILWSSTGRPSWVPIETISRISEDTR